MPMILGGSGTISSDKISVDTSGNFSVGPNTPYSAVGFTPRVHISGSYPAFILQGSEGSGKKWTVGETAGSLAFYNDTDALERMRIDTSGRVTKPYQPFFLARNGDESGDGITTNPFRFSNVIYNVGNHFVTSGTGAYTRFVAPVNGVYAFTANPGYKQTSVDFVCRAAVNGTVFTDMIRLIGYPNSHSSGCYGFNIYLNANDYVSLSSEGSTYHRNNGGVPNWFSGVLLG